MNLKHLTDKQLSADLKKLVSEERTLLTTILYHLKEIEDRKLFVEYKCRSLFDYACKELKYSSDQAYRRIQAMRLLKQVPEVAPKINSGELSLSNINQAQRFFNENKVTQKIKKIIILKKLVNKSVRDGQKEILKLAPQKPLPRETQKQVSPTYTHVSFNMSENLEHKLAHIKSLLGPKSYNMSLADLIDSLADLASEKLQENKFGKKRIRDGVRLGVEDRDSVKVEIEADVETEDSVKVGGGNGIEVRDGMKIETKEADDIKVGTPLFKPAQSTLNVQGKVKGLISNSKNPRYVSREIKHFVWRRDKAQCTHCQSKTNLHFDHIEPVALGGITSVQNLRLLCFHCNQRQRINMRLGEKSTNNRN